MKCVTTYKILNGNTINGSTLKVEQMYSTFDPNEFEALKERMEATIGAGICSEYNEVRNSMKIDQTETSVEHNTCV